MVVEGVILYKIEGRSFSVKETLGEAEGNEGAGLVEEKLAEERAGAKSLSEEPAWILCKGSAHTARPQFHSPLAGH